MQRDPELVQQRCCRWLENGGSLAALQEMMGHTSIVTTQRYARLEDVHVKREAELMEGRLATKVVAKASAAGCD